MKKTYNTPEILVCTMNEADIIATSVTPNSITGGGTNKNGGPTAAEGNSRGNAIWDD